MFMLLAAPVHSPLVSGVRSKFHCFCTLRTALCTRNHETERQGVHEGERRSARRFDDSQIAGGQVNRCGALASGVLRACPVSGSCSTLSRSIKHKGRASEFGTLAACSRAKGTDRFSCTSARNTSTFMRHRQAKFDINTQIAEPIEEVMVGPLLTNLA